MARTIAHVDMDAFYASVEQRERPALRGKPVIVGGRPEQRGVVAAASYEARRFGVHSAMPARTALRLCPHAELLPARMDYYREVSQQVFAIFGALTDLVEPLSLDEAFLDLSHRAGSLDEAERLARAIKTRVLRETKLTCSVGVGPNKFLAKLASERDKPDGLFLLVEEDVPVFLESLPLQALWGVGPSTLKHLEALGVATMTDLRACGMAELVRHLGAHGAHLWQLARGRDARPVVPHRPSKSISRETTFARDVTSHEEMLEALRELTRDTMAHVRRQGLQGKTVHLKVRLGDFTTLTRNGTLAWPTQDPRPVWSAVQRLLRDRIDLGGQGVRLLGVGLSGLSPHNHGQLPLFDFDDLLARGRR